MPKKTKELPVIFDGGIRKQTAVIDFRGLKKVDQDSIWDAIDIATGISFWEKRQDGRRIVLQFAYTHPGTLLSFLREIVVAFGYRPVQAQAA